MHLYSSVRQILWCVIIWLSHNISIIIESLYCDIIVIVGHISRIVLYCKLIWDSLIWTHFPRIQIYLIFPHCRSPSVYNKRMTNMRYSSGWESPEALRYDIIMILESRYAIIAILRYVEYCDIIYCDFFHPFQMQIIFPK